MKTPLLVPIRPFDERAMAPGTPVFGVAAEQFHGIDILRVGEFKTCSVDNPHQWFRGKAVVVTFSSQGGAELEDLRGFLGAPAGSMNGVDNVDVKLDASSLHTPYPHAQHNFTKALSGANCAARDERAKVAMIVRPVIADISLTFTGRGLTRRQAAAFISKADPAPDVATDGTSFKVVLLHRLVALRLAESP